LREVAITIGHTTHQDLLLDLGSPVRRFWKEDERLGKMWGDASAESAEGDCKSPHVTL
jgi:hypothetical protein